METIAITSEIRVRGITREETSQTSLLADDLLLNMSDLMKGVPHLLELLQRFGKNEGYKII